MDIDISVLRLMEREKDVPFDVLVNAIEEALLTRVREDRRGRARRAGGAEPQDRPRDRAGARAATTRATRSGSTTAPRRASAGWPHRPRGRSSCSGCATPRTSRSTATSPGWRATSSPASCSRAATPVRCWSTWARSRRSCRWPSRCRGSATARHPDQGLRRLGPPRAARSAGRGVPDPSRAGREAVQARGARDRRRNGGDQGRRARGRAPQQDRGGQPPRATSARRVPASGRWVSGSGR